MAVYPTGIVGTGTLITIVATEPTNNPSHTGQHNNINGEVIAIETALGTSPQGSYATVSAALSTHGTLITAAQTTATSGVVNALAAQTTANTAVAAASAAQTTANTALANAATAQTTANARATYPGAGVPLSTGSAWSTSYAVGTATGNLMQVNTLGAPSVSYPYIKISNTHPQNTAGGQATTGSWVVMPLNTKDSDTASIVSAFSGGVVSIPAGTYKTWADSPFIQAGLFQTRVSTMSGTAGTPLLIGSAAYQTSGLTYTNAISVVRGVFTVTAGTNNVALQYQAGASYNTNDLGQPCNFGVEVYSQLILEKIG